MDYKAFHKHKLHIDNRGYSLIELVIVLAIIAVLMGTVFYSIILVFSANAKSCANNIQRSIGDCKVTTMGKADAYMELFRESDGTVYTQLLVTECDGTVTDEERQKVGTNKVYVGYEADGDTKTSLEAGDKIVIRFDRSSGGFRPDAGGVIYKNIYVEGGSKKYRIEMIPFTGKSQVIVE